VWICLLLLHIWCKQQSCWMKSFSGFIKPFYFSKISWCTRFTCSDRFCHDEGLKHHIFNFDKHLISFQSIFWNLGFERLMHSSALEVSAESKDDALTGNEYMQKKQRTDASKVTNPWLMGLFSSKYMCFGVWELNSFLHTLAKLPVCLAVHIMQHLLVFNPCFE
jgi:hypothetical protein